MKPGHIDQFVHLSKFQSVKLFNETMKVVRKQYEHHFTKGEKIALLTLIQYSVKIPGICNARICKLVQAAQTHNGVISRSTFERMLRKAKTLGILSIHHTTRQQGGFSHNIYVFHPFDRAQDQQLTDRRAAKKPDTPSHPAPEKALEASLLKTKEHKDKDLRQSSKLDSETTLEQLDHTFVPSYVPTPFVKTVKPFFNRSKDICSLWDRITMAYRSMKFAQPIETLLPPIIQAFKETIYKYKQNYIKTSFIQYFYGTVAGKLAIEKRRMTFEGKAWGRWLEKR
ncbi:hypothetical protein [Alkalihalobacterium alkalinitrilicum]|uniref:hypothetical protein n=1 Tax=Alkalihalobacterium alkalinitrilicum TaxID=427920 RepID=UPI0009954E2A|nr:hypothetical protein [Alkalihalobacterium alkalinitrilicum]